MKKILVLFALLMTGVMGIHAQEGLKWGAMAGMNSSKFSTDGFDSKVGFHVGIKAEKDLPQIAQGVYLDMGLCKLNCVMLYSHSISSVGERPAPRGGTTRPDECKITTI